MGLQLWKSLIVLSIFLLSLRKIRVCADPQVPCLFFFGDSYFDTGNNNNRATSAKADYLPYGIDFSNSVPTGRFTNDMNMADFTAKLLGFSDFQPPFSQATGQNILQGVNYASGFSGIRDETGRNWGLVTPMSQQILNHQIIISRIVSLLSSTSSAEALLNKCIYNFNVGSNDYMDNYFVSTTTRLLMKPEQYALALVQQLRIYLETLYRVGARKFVVHGVGLIGCTPYAKAKFPTYGDYCALWINYVSNFFNVQVKSLVIQLNADFPNAKFTFINSTALLSPKRDDDSIVNIPCCELSSSGVLCKSESTPCADRNEYVFYDAVHPTNATFYPAALQAYNPSTPDAVYPYSISHLAVF